MTKNKFFTLAIASMLLISPVFASEVKKATVKQVDLSFEQAYELMYENNNALKGATETIKQKNYERKSAIGQYFPKVGVNATTVHFSEPAVVTSQVPMFGSLPTTVQQENTSLFSGGVVWNIFTGGKLIQNHKAAKARLEGANEKYRQIQGDLTSELVKRYFGLRLAQDVVVVRRQYRDDVKKHLDDAKLLEKEGIIAKSERLHAEVAFTQAQRELDAAYRDKNIVEEGLKTLIKDKNARLDDVEVNPNSLLFVYNAEFLPLNEYKALASDKNPMLKQLGVKKKLANANYKAKLANYSPTVSLFAYDVLAQTQLTTSVPRWAVGGSVNFAVFDGLSRYNDVQAAKVGKKIVEYETQDAEFNIESLVTKQYQELYKYKEVFESTNKSLESAKEALRTTNLGFKEGFRTSLEVTDAEMMLAKVKIERLNALYNYDLTLSELLKTTGEPEKILEYMKNSTKEKL